MRTSNSEVDILRFFYFCKTKPGSKKIENPLITYTQIV